MLFWLTVGLCLLSVNCMKLTAQNVMGGALGDSSALLDLQSESRGLLIPRMSSAQRSAIANPATGLLIYNTSLNCVEINAGSDSSPDWVCLRGGGKCAALNCAAASRADSLLVGWPAGGISVSVPYTGGDGGLHNGQVVASGGVLGLTATLPAGAFAEGSGSLTYTIAGTPTSVGTASFALELGGQTCTLHISVISSCGAYTSSGVWKEFMCHNLGATTTAHPFMPSWELVGNYYQWGRNPNCFGRDGIDGSNPCSSPVQGAAGPWGSGTGNDNAAAIAGWDASVGTDNAWQDAVKTANDPCPAGFRVPTRDQWDGVRNDLLNNLRFVGTWTNTSTNYSSGVKLGGALFLPATGIRSPSNGELFQRGLTAYYWSSTLINATNPLLLVLRANEVSMGAGVSRATGSSLRCIAE